MWADAWNKLMLPLGTIMSGLGMSNIDMAYKVIVGSLGVMILIATLVHWVLKIQTQVSVRNKARDDEHVSQIEKEIKENESKGES